MTLRKHLTAVLVALALLSAPGCLGRMAVTRGVKTFNLNATESRWGREVLFVGMYIIPVYPTAFFLDLFVVNAVEFWRGQNPIDGESAVVDS